MGFFRSIGSFIGSVIETAGRLTGIETIERIGQGIQDWCSDVGEAGSYNKETASTADTEKINELLTVFSAQLKDDADELERKVIAEVRSYYDEIFKMFDEQGADISFNQMRWSMTKTERKLQGRLKSHLARRVSIDDQQCLDILSLEAGEEKKKKLDRFGGKVLQEGLLQLANQTNQMVSNYNKELYELLQQQVEQREKNLQQAQKQYEDILVQTEHNILNRESMRLKPFVMLHSLKTMKEIL